MAEPADDMQGIANPIRHSQSHLGHGPFNHQGLHLPIKLQDAPGSDFHLRVVGPHSLINTLNMIEKQAYRGNDHKDDAIESPTDRLAAGPDSRVSGKNQEILEDVAHGAEQGKPDHG